MSGTSTTQTAIVERPHCGGNRPVVLQAGPSDYADHVCSPDVVSRRP